MRKNSLKGESGYTLVETLVAMSIFVLVLSVFFTFFVKILFNEKIMEQKKGLLLGQSNLILQSEDLVLQDSRAIIDNMIVDKHYVKDGRLVTLVVSVQKRDDNKEIVKLSKSFLIGK
ncbi:MAG: prepilin-type N-terminal cleavage/methylation domain-containing protein [Bacteroidota bacterium]